jgi:hypothetical protein
MISNLLILKREEYKTNLSKLLMVVLNISTHQVALRITPSMTMLTLPKTISHKLLRNQSPSSSSWIPLMAHLKLSNLRVKVVGWVSSIFQWQPQKQNKWKI